MPFTPAQRTKTLKPSATLAMAERAGMMKAAGIDVISLATGEPDFPTPTHIKDAAIEAIHNDQTRYTAVDGTPELKAAIQAKLQRENRLDYALNEIIAGVGGKGVLYNLMMALLSPGDEVVIPAPYWVSYPPMATLAEAKSVIIPADEAQQFKITPTQLADAITDKTRLFILNSPSNPTGMMYTTQELRALADVLIQYPQVYIACDDIYEHIIWDDFTFSTLLNVAPELRERVIILNAVSKTYAMTGWRIGYAAGNADLIKTMKKIQSQSTSNPTSIAQAAAAAALNGGLDCVNTMRDAFKMRHDYLVGALNAIAGISCLETQGTFYAFACVKDLIDSLDGVDDDVALATFLLENAQVSTVPGSAFGLPGYLRLSYATSMPNLTAAIENITLCLRKPRKLLS